MTGDQDRGGRLPRTPPGSDPAAEGPGSAPDEQARKQALRRQIRARRRARSEPDRDQVAHGLADVVQEMPEVRAAHCVALYASMPGEPGTGPLRQALRRRGLRVLLPVVLEDLDLDWAEDDGADQPSRRGGPHPGGPRLGPEAVADADVVVVPALAVDSHGRRIGQGGGSYDRALRRVSPHALVVALLHDDEVLDADSDPLPALPHDLPVARAATPTRWILLGAAPRH